MASWLGHPYHLLTRLKKRLLWQALSADKQASRTGALSGSLSVYCFGVTGF